MVLRYVGCKVVYCLYTILLIDFGIDMILVDQFVLDTYNNNRIVD